jgi:hypothetical protein
MMTGTRTGTMNSGGRNDCDNERDWDNRNKSKRNGHGDDKNNTSDNRDGTGGTTA